MAFEKISEEELASVGVELLDDLPGLAPDAMKAKFEETAKKLLAPKFNKLVEQLEAGNAAGSLGAQLPDGLPEDTEKTVQAILLALMIYVQAHEKKQDNPHNVTAEQSGAYSKEETDRKIDEKIVEIGSGDMAKAVYDPNGIEKDIYRFAEHPVGYIFDWAPVEGNHTDLSTPQKVAEYFGYGRWKEITGVFMLSRSSNHDVGSTGGKETVALTTPQIAEHTHELLCRAGTGYTVSNALSSSAYSYINPPGGDAIGLKNVCRPEGQGQPHENMPPYLVCYRWQRIA